MEHRSFSHDFSFHFYDLPPTSCDRLVAHEIAFAQFSTRLVGPLSRYRWIAVNRASFRKNLFTRLAAEYRRWLASHRFVHGVYTPMVDHAPKIDSERHRQGIDLGAQGWFVVTCRNCAYFLVRMVDRSEIIRRLRERAIRGRVHFLFIFWY